MRDEGVDRLREIARELTGIVLPETKRGLVAARVARRLTALDLPDVGAYAAFLRSPTGAAEIPTFIDLISTHFTHFFREAHHFEHFAQHLAARPPGVETRVWCGAASTGQEPWSIAMVLAESGGRPWRLLCTDISRASLEAAARGVYAEGELGGVSTERRARWFQRREEDRKWRVRDTLRGGTHFAALNLCDARWPMRGPFHTIFLRNVLIYLDQDQRTDIVGRCGALLAPGGLLFLGGAEALPGRIGGLEPVGTSTWRRP